MEYRVIKVNLIGNGIKYIPQYKVKELKKYMVVKFIFPIIKFETIERWKRFYKIKKGTDEFIPCYYDTLEEAWKRIDKRKSNLKIKEQSYDIIEYHYE